MHLKNLACIAYAYKFTNESEEEQRGMEVFRNYVTFKYLITKLHFLEKSSIRMVRNLEKVWEHESHSYPGVIEHFFDTINSLGGLKGLFLLAIFFLCFYWYILHVISNRHKSKKK